MAASYPTTPMNANSKVAIGDPGAGQKRKHSPMGDLLFSVVNVCRLAGKNPDIALFASTNKFISRFRAMENAIKKSGKCLEDLTLSEMDVYWNTGKRGGQRV